MPQQEARLSVAMSRLRKDTGGRTQSCEHSHGALSVPPGLCLVLQTQCLSWFGPLGAKLENTQWSQGVQLERDPRSGRGDTIAPEVGKMCFQGRCWGLHRSHLAAVNRGESWRAEGSATLFSSVPHFGAGSPGPSILGMS